MADSIDRRTRALERRSKRRKRRDPEFEAMLEFVALHRRLHFDRPRSGDLERYMRTRRSYDLEHLIRAADHRFWQRQIRPGFDGTNHPASLLYEIVSYRPEENVPEGLVDALLVMARPGEDPPPHDLNKTRERWVEAQLVLMRLGEDFGMSLRTELARRRDLEPERLIAPALVERAAGEMLTYELGIVEDAKKRAERRASLIAADQMYWKRMRGENVEPSSIEDLLYLILSYTPIEEVPERLRQRWRTFQTTTFRSKDQAVRAEYFRMYRWIEELGIQGNWGMMRRIHLAHVRSTNPEYLVPSKLVDDAVSRGRRVAYQEGRYAEVD